MRRFVCVCSFVCQKDVRLSLGKCIFYYTSQATLNTAISQHNIKCSAAYDGGCCICVRRAREKRATGDIVGIGSSSRHQDPRCRDVSAAVAARLFSTLSHRPPKHRFCINHSPDCFFLCASAVCRLQWQCRALAHIAHPRRCRDADVGENDEAAAISHRRKSEK